LTNKWTTSITSTCIFALIFEIDELLVVYKTKNQITLPGSPPAHKKLVVSKTNADPKRVVRNDAFGEVTCKITI
jgi:hypothetical protein